MPTVKTAAHDTMVMASHMLAQRSGANRSSFAINYLEMAADIVCTLAQMDYASVSIKGQVENQEEQYNTSYSRQYLGIGGSLLHIERENGKPVVKMTNFADAQRAMLRDSYFKIEPILTITMQKCQIDISRHPSWVPSFIQGCKMQLSTPEPSTKPQRSIRF